MGLLPLFHLLDGPEFDFDEDHSIWKIVDVIGFRASLEREPLLFHSHAAFFVHGLRVLERDRILEFVSDQLSSEFDSKVASVVVGDSDADLLSFFGMEVALLDLGLKEVAGDRDAGPRSQQELAFDFFCHNIRFCV